MYWRDPKAGSDATVITPDTILGYQDIFSSSVSSNILAFFAPFKEFELHSIDSQPEALDIIYDRTRDLIATSGNSALLSITDKPSIASVKAAQAIQAARIDYLTRQYEDFLNEVINSSFGLKYTWKVSLWGDIFSIRDDQKNIKEAVLNGALGLIPKLLSAHGYTTEEYIASEAYVNALGIKLEMVTSASINEKRSSDSSSSSVTGKTTGRTAIEETEITNDSTAASRDQGTNVSEIKEFSEEELQEKIEDIVNSL